MPKSDKNGYREVHLQLANNKKDQSGSHNSTYRKKMSVSGICFLKEKAR